MSGPITASARLKAMFESGTHSDFTIKCGGETFRVHKCVLAQHGGPFAAACSGQFKEGVEGVLNCPDDKPDAVKAIIQFFYTSDYMFGNSNTYLEFQLNVYEIAHKYLEPYLQRLAKNRYLDRVNSICFITDSSLVHAARQIWRDDPLKQDKELREATVRAIIRHSADLFGGNDTLSEENRQIFLSVRIQVDLAMGNRPAGIALMSCPNCDEASEIQPKNHNKDSYCCPHCDETHPRHKWDLVWGDE